MAAGKLLGRAGGSAVLIPFITWGSGRGLCGGSARRGSLLGHGLEKQGEEAEGCQAGRDRLGLGEGGTGWDLGGCSLWVVRSVGQPTSPGLVTCGLCDLGHLACPLSAATAEP